jgi:hypothetical protein
MKIWAVISGNFFVYLLAQEISLLLPELLDGVD